MVFSNTTTKAGIVQEIERLCDLGQTYISGDATRLAEHTATINRVNHRVWHTIFMATGNWKYDDGGHTDQPYATANLVEDRIAYALPTDLLSVERIEVKDDNGQWFRLNPLTEERIPGAIDEFNDVSSLPVYYTLVNNTIKLYPASDFSQDASLKIYFSRDSVDFLTTDTTKTPGFASPYHEILPIKAAIEWYKVKQPQSPTLPILIQDDLKLEQSLKEYYGKRFKDYKPRISRAYARYK
jgi:hypothetical protein